MRLLLALALATALSVPAQAMGLDAYHDAGRPGYFFASIFVAFGLLGFAGIVVLLSCAFERRVHIVQRLVFAILAVAACIVTTSAFAADSDGTQPDPVLTPGVVRTTDLATILSETTARVRDVSGAEKLAVYRRYGMTGPHDAIPGTDHMAPFEIDHRVPLCAGGANDIANLWVEAGDGAWTFHDKDRLEDRTCQKLKRGLITVEQAQAVFLGDWKAAYVTEFGGTPR